VHRIIAAVFVAQNVFPIEQVRDPEIENDKFFVEVEVFAAVNVQSLVGGVSLAVRIPPEWKKDVVDLVPFSSEQRCVRQSCGIRKPDT